MDAILRQYLARFRWTAAVLGLVLWAHLGVDPAGADRPGDPAAIQTVADWIIGLQYNAEKLPSYGAVKIHHGPGYIDPQGYYFRVLPYSANLGLVGLLQAPVEDKLEIAERWIDWYLGHLDMNSQPPGRVYDHWYRADGTDETTAPSGCDNHDPSRPNCDWDDATDSYAATFLGLVETYYQEGGSDAFLQRPGVEKQLEAIAGVILALQQADGLTWAKADYRVKFLMDNSEVYWGLKAMARLKSEVFGDRRGARTYEKAARKLRQGMQKYLFDRKSRRYHVARFEDGSVQPADLDQWYPGSVALAWPHLFGVTSPRSSRPRIQMRLLNASWDGSPNPDWSTNLVDLSGFPWTSIGYAALLVGDQERTRRHARLVQQLKFPSAADPVGFAWPFAVDDGGWLLRTLSSPYRQKPHQESSAPFGIEHRAEKVAAERMTAEKSSASHALLPNAPNPFNPSTQITYSLSQDRAVSLVVYNLMGQSVRVLVDGFQSPGSHRVEWDGRDASGRQVAAGIYFYRLQAGSFAAVRKMILAP